MLLQLLKIESLVALYRHSALKDDGWFRSFHDKSSVDASGNPIPWLTYPMIDFITPRLSKSMDVFEFGSGQSTLFFASRVNSVVSVENDMEWVGVMQAKAPKNVDIIYHEMVPGGAYSRAIAETRQKFHIITLDGRDRVNCALNVISSDALHDDGIIIFDDTDRDDYSEAYSALIENGFKRMDYFGMAPIIDFKKCSSIFFRKTDFLTWNKCS
jgi:hypothetical protein